MPVKDITIRYSSRDLTEQELQFVFEAQRAVMQAGGALGLYDDLTFLIAHRGDPNDMLGLIAWRRDDQGDAWIQLAYTRPEFRARGVFRALVDVVVVQNPDRRIGLGTQRLNLPMISAAERVGFRQNVVYLWRQPLMN